MSLGFHLLCGTNSIPLYHPTVPPLLLLFFSSTNTQHFGRKFTLSLFCTHTYLINVLLPLRLLFYTMSSLNNDVNFCHRPSLKPVRIRSASPNYSGRPTSGLEVKMEVFVVDLFQRVSVRGRVLRDDRRESLVSAENRNYFEILLKG